MSFALFVFLAAVPRAIAWGKADDDKATDDKEEWVLDSDGSGCWVSGIERWCPDDADKGSDKGDDKDDDTWGDKGSDKGDDKNGGSWGDKSSDRGDNKGDGSWGDEGKEGSTGAMDEWVLDPSGSGCYFMGTERWCPGDDDKGGDEGKTGSTGAMDEWVPDPSGSGCYFMGTERWCPGDDDKGSATRDDKGADDYSWEGKDGSWEEKDGEKGAARDDKGGDDDKWEGKDGSWEGKDGGKGALDDKGGDDDSWEDKDGGKGGLGVDSSNDGEVIGAECSNYRRLQTCEAVLEPGKGCFLKTGNGWLQCSATDRSGCEEMCFNADTAATNCGEIQGEEDGGMDRDKEEAGTKSVQQSGTRQYELILPAMQPAGLVVAFFGCSQLRSLTQSRGVALVCPEPAAGSDWNSFGNNSDDSDYIGMLIQNLTAEHDIPERKVIVTGFSWGGSMAYRIGCERSDVIGGVVVYGQAFVEPSVGHIEKSYDETHQSLTAEILQRMAAARQTSQRCEPEFKRPHFALVGLQDIYYGERCGTYQGKALWEFYSTQVLGCNDEQVVAHPVISGSTCSTYASCSMGATPNTYCTVDNMGHDTVGWDNFVASAFDAFFEETGQKPSKKSKRGRTARAKKARKQGKRGKKTARKRARKSKSNANSKKSKK